MQGNLIKNLFTKLGENNKAVYVAIVVALAKGIFRPTFTMMDKEQDPQSKRYAAYREGITEAIAVPTYAVVELIANKLAPKFLDKKLVRIGSEKENNLLTLTVDSRRKFDSILKTKTEDLSKLGSQEKELFETYKKCLKTVNSTTGFIGVSIASFAIIPALCNIVLNPIMKKFVKKKETDEVEDTSLKSFKDLKNPANFDNKYCIKNAYNPALLYAYKPSSVFGMKVGL